MAILHLVLLIFAFVCFVLSAIGVVTARYNVLAMGLAFWILSLIIPA